MTDRDEFEQIDSLHAQGMLTDDEHAQARERLLARGESGTSEAEEAGTSEAEEVGASEAEEVGASEAEEAGAPEPRRGQPNWLAVGLVAIAVAGVALIVVALVGVGSSSSSSQPGIMVNGVVAVTDPNHTNVFPDDPNVQQGQHFGSGGYNLGKPCHTLAGYQDIVVGANVVISDGTGKTLTTTHLRAGIFDSSADCVFGFTAAVPKVATYQVKIGQRDPVPYTQQQIANPQLILR